MKFEHLYFEAMSDRQKEYMRKYQAKKAAEKRAASVADLEGEVRDTAYVSMDEPEKEYTLNNLVGRVVELQLRNGKSIKGIVQEPRKDSILDTAGRGSLRIIDLKSQSPEVRLIPKIWIVSGKVGNQDIKITQMNKEVLRRGESMKVKGSKGNVYKVTRDKNDKWTCTCPAFAWQKGDCKHIRGVKSGEIQ